MKRLLLGALALVLAGGGVYAADLAHARHRHIDKINCGWPHPDPACTVNPTPSPAPPPEPVVSPSTSDIISALINFQGEVIADLVQADATQAAVLNPATGAAWDPFSHMCLAGVPAIGAPGQPGYVPASPGLIRWIQGLQAPTVASVPPLPASPSAATLAVHARILIIAAASDVSSLATQIDNGGFPASIRLACGSVVNDTVNQAAGIVGQVAVFDATLAKFLPAGLMAKAHAAALAKPK
jgi:hypothetical protein